MLCGYHPHPEAIYAEGDLSILSSISEGFPYTVIESMACGIPVVATGVGGVPEALDSSCGRICSPRNPGAMAEAVIELLLDHSLRSALGKNARNRVKERFSIDLFTETFEQIYDSLVLEQLVPAHQIV